MAMVKVNLSIPVEHALLRWSGTVYAWDTETGKAYVRWDDPSLDDEECDPWDLICCCRNPQCPDRNRR
jgi:hypothetical protein